MATVAIPFIVVLWQNKWQKSKYIDAIKICEIFTNEIIPSYLNFKNIFESDEMSFLNRIHSDEDNTQLLLPFGTNSEEIKKCSEMTESCQLLNEAMILFNKMDLFSTKVLHLNKSELLYAKTYCRNAFVDILHKYSGLYDILMFEHENDYVNLRHLYEMWK